MKKKELKELATLIARYEHQLQHTSNEKVKQQLEMEIMRLCGSVTDIEDMMAIDELVMKILEKK